MTVAQVATCLQHLKKLLAKQSWFLSAAVNYDDVEPYISFKVRKNLPRPQLPSEIGGLNVLILTVA